MRLKEVNNKVAHIAWSPLSIYPNYLVAGSASENPDTSNSNSATLDLLKLDLSNPSTDLQIDATLSTESRFSKLIWSEYSCSNSKNLIIGGCENSKIYLYDYEKILNYQSHLNSSKTDPLINTLAKHTGSVSSLDINPFQHNLLASGGGQSEIFIWDLNNPSVPMTPGAKMQPLDDINCVSWNNQVQHILASTCSGKCVVWDLRKNESIIKVSDNMSKMKAKLVAWHPEIATQMCLSSDDDQSPYLQIWDLRFATSPVRILEGHQRGILSFRWCSDDANLLISSAKDNRLLCWNPNNPTCNGEILYELPTIGQWCFDLSWCKRNPDLVCASSFEGQINVYTLMGGRYNVIQQTSSKIMDSFGDVPSTPPVPAQQQQITQTIPQLKLAPKWMKRPCGAVFAFGGKLVTFGRTNLDAQQQQNEQLVASSHLTNQHVVIQQVVTDLELVEKSQQLESCLQTGNLIEYCNYKIETNESNNEQSFIWKFIQATFDVDKNTKYMELLGFSNQNLESKIEKFLKPSEKTADESASAATAAESLNHNDEKLKSLNLNGTSSLFANNNNLNDDLSSANNFEELARALSPVNLSFKNNIESLISELLLSGRYEKAVSLCIQESRFTDAILIANFFDQSLLAKAQKQYFKMNKSEFSSFLEKFLNRDWSNIIETCNLDDWKDALAALLTYTSSQEFAMLCDKLGYRLEDNGSDSNLLNACVCYILSFNLDNLVNCWQKVYKQNDADSSSALQDLIEKIMVLRYSYQNVHKDLNKILDQNHSFDKLNSKLVKYAKLLADQGCFLNAYNYINDSNDNSILIMKDRLYNVLDINLIKQYGLRKPECPYSIKKQEPAPRPRTNSYSITSQSNNQVYQQQTNQPTTVSNSITTTRKSFYQADPSITNKQPVNPYNNSNNMGYQSSQTLKAVPSHPVPTPAMYTPASYNQPALVNPGPPQPTSQPANLFTPAAQQQVPQATSNMPTIPSYMNTKPATAWNDPPVVTPKIKQAANTLKDAADMPTFFQPTMPIQQMQSSMIPGYQQPSLSSFSQTLQTPQQTYIQQRVQPSPQPIQQQQQQQQHQMQQQQNLQEKSIEKGPVSAENQIIQTVLDTLLNKSLSVATMPAVRRKLDDVAKKLDSLYDKLRDSTLSAGVLQGIHSMIQYIQAHDYQSALILHSQIVATSNFTEISGFMPGLKVLIQSCQQLNVTL